MKKIIKIICTSLWNAAIYKWWWCGIYPYMLKRHQSEYFTTSTPVYKLLKFTQYDTDNERQTPTSTRIPIITRLYRFYSTYELLYLCKIPYVQTFNILKLLPVR